MRIPPNAVATSKLSIVRNAKSGAYLFRSADFLFKSAASLLLFTAMPAVGADKCIPFTDAPKKIDENVCITGKIVKVNSSARSGTAFLNFCENYKGCAFSVVVFPRDLEKIGDVRALEGQVIEIHGRIKEYKGQAEMVLEDVKQLSGPVTKLPPLPKNYDVENQGKYSAGQFGTPKKPNPGPKSKSQDNLPPPEDPPPTYPPPTN